MKLYYTTDLHGSTKCWKKFLFTPKYYQADVIVIGGDITGKLIVPIVHPPRGRAEATFMGRKRKFRKEKDIEQFKQIVADVGQYAVDMTKDEYEAFERDPSKLDALFVRILVERVEEWVALAEERLTGQNVRCLVSAGNDDIFGVDEPLLQSKVIEVHDSRVLDLDGGFQIFGFSYANMTPWKCPRDIEEEEISERLEVLASQIRDMDRAIFDIHAPPYDSGLDEAPELRADMSYVRDATGQPNMVPVGSKAVREFILKYQPMLALHGHIHESAGIKKLGGTTIVNPGSEYGEGVLRGALVELDPEQGLVGVNLVTG
jgi:Icc-related predicted phosphoesterase